MLETESIYESNYQFLLTLGLTDEDIRSVVASINEEQLELLDEYSKAWMFMKCYKEGR